MNNNSTFTVKGTDAECSKPIQVKFDRIVKYLDSGKLVNKNFAANYNSSLYVSSINSSLLATAVRSNRSQQSTCRAVTTYIIFW